MRAFDKQGIHSMKDSAVIIQSIFGYLKKRDIDFKYVDHYAIGQQVKKKENQYQLNSKFIGKNKG